MRNRFVKQVVPKEWPTLVVLFVCYGVFITLLVASHWLSVWFTVPALAIVLALHSSLQHEVLHGHPFLRQSLNESLVFPALGLFIPYLRFKTTHLEHHHDSRLTDPYDDPESNYLDPLVWNHMSALKKSVYRFNNTLLGRMTIGPAISLLVLYRQDLKLMFNHDKSIVTAYFLHALGVLVPVIIWYHYSNLALGWYVLSAYMALSILKIRTFLEHRAHPDVSGRTVTIDDRGLLAFLFLNNNFHSVHHAHPRMPWYALPEHYHRHRTYFDAVNDGYTYRSYIKIIRKFLLKAKDPVPHPLVKN